MLHVEGCAFASLSTPPQARFPVIQATGNPLPSHYRIPGSTPGGVSGWGGGLPDPEVRGQKWIGG